MERESVKSECPLRPSEIKNTWHIMKNLKFCIFRPLIPYGNSSNVVGFFP